MSPFASYRGAWPLDPAAHSAPTLGTHHHHRSHRLRLTHSLTACLSGPVGRSVCLVDAAEAYRLRRPDLSLGKLVALGKNKAGS
jgi:hypothetical protein